MKQSGIIYYYPWDHPSPEPVSIRPVSHGQVRHRTISTSQQVHQSISQILGIGFVALALGGLAGPLSPFIRMEGGYRLMQISALTKQQMNKVTKVTQNILAGISKNPSVASKPTIKPVVFTPLTAPDGSEITPVDTNFSLVIPKVGINAKVIPAVNPTNPGEYEKALTEGVAHASTSYFPNENGTVYLFSHSTSYDWFVKDLNAVFYLVKNLDIGDQVVIVYKGDRYTYKITDKKVVSPESVAYMAPRAGTKNLILQTCWPPGSTSERLLIFADLIKDPNIQI